jgi:outer membrane immunogenic protein
MFLRSVLPRSMFPRSVALVPVFMLSALAMAGRAEAQSAPPANFQGGYVGAHLGGGKGSATRASTSGAIGGLQGGYNMQSGQIVFGGEADISASGIKRSNAGESYKQGTTGSVRARVGAVFDRVLVYGTGGVALQGNSLQIGYGESSNTHVGSVIGAGAEVLLTQNVSARGEYLRYDFNGHNYNTAIGPVKVSPNLNVLRGGLNYKF